MITCHPTEAVRLEAPENEFKPNHLFANNNSNSVVKNDNSITSSHQKIPMKCLACDFTFIYPSKLAAHLSSYPDHCLIHPNSVKSETPSKKDKAPSTHLDILLFNNSEGINEKDLIIIDDFINALLSNKFS